MELNFRAETIARLEDPDMLGMSPMRLFYGDSVSKVDSDELKDRAFEVFSSVKKLVMLISAGYDNDMKKAFEVFDSELASGKSQFDIGNEVFNKLIEGNYLGGNTEKKDLADNTPSENNGKTTK